MAAKTKQSNRPVSDKPVVVVDDVHIIYKVFASGRRATKAGAGGGLFSRKMRLREVHAVKGLSFTVFEGESVGIIGSNGSGKSSLMRAIAGLTPIQGGAVYASAKPALLGVGAVLLPNLSGEKNILLGGLAMGCWFLSIAIGNNLAGIFAGEVSGAGGMTAASALSGYTFGFYALVGAGVLLFLIAPLIQKLMHGVK